MQDNLVQSLWVGPRLGTMERLCLTSFMRHGHRMRLFVYDRVENVPEGVEQVSAEEILPRREIFHTRAGGLANFADLFRYKLLLEHGGWWVDCDVVCLRPWTFADPTIVCSTDELGHGRMPNVFVLRAAAGSPLMQACLEACAGLGDEKFVFGQTGPFLIHRVLQEREFAAAIFPPEVFAPVPWNAPQYFTVRRPFFRHAFHLKNVVRRRHLIPRFRGKTAGVHLWSGMWRPSGLDPDRPAARGSLYASYRRRFLSAA